MYLCCIWFSESTVQKNGDKGKRTSDRDRTQDLYSFAELQPQAIYLVPAANPLSPIALCTICYVPYVFFWAMDSENHTAQLATPAHTEVLQALRESGRFVHHMLAGSPYTLVAHWTNYHHITQYQPRGVGPKRLLDSGTPVTGTQAIGDEGSAAGTG